MSAVMAADIITEGKSEESEALMLEVRQKLGGSELPCLF